MSLWRSCAVACSKSKMYKFPVRHLNLLEYQSKTLLKQYNVTVQDFCMIDENGDGECAAFRAKEYAIKAQILAGGRGKGHFDNGFKGGVRIVQNRAEIPGIAKQMLGHRLITKQTPAEGILVKKVMVAEGANIIRETYLCIVMDPQRNGPVVVASPAGGVDIEAVAEKTPDLIKIVPIDIVEGVTDRSANELADFLQFKGQLKAKAAEEIKKLWHLFVAVDALQVEINPLVETDDGKVISVDAKLNFDDNARYRQKDIFALEDSTEYDPKEIEAAKYNLKYVGMSGNIGCLVNGAGLAMATMDIIKLHGGEPAHFLDMRGGVHEDQVRAAIRIIASDPSVGVVLVNVFGGIVDCATIANGIVSVLKQSPSKVPLVVRLEGTNASDARRIIKESGLNIQIAADLDEAARKSVASLK